MKTNLRKDYPNATESMSNKWIERFQKTENKEDVERLFDFLEDKYIEEARKILPLTDDVVVRVDIISRNWKNFFQISLEKLTYDSDYDAWESSNIFPVTIEVKVADYYKNWEEDSMQEMLEDFLKRLPDPIDLALI